MKFVLRIANVTAGYGKLPVVYDVSIGVSKEEIVTIVGPNGSGKSTVIKSVLGLAKVFNGVIAYDGTDITHKGTDAVARLGVGYVPQLENVFTNLTVEENLEMGAYIRRDEATVKSDINGVYDIFPELRARKGEVAGKLSGGERQMVAIARAMMMKPKVLLLDEPTASLAPRAASLVLSKIREIRDRGVPVLMAEQNARKALASSDKGFVLVAGRCVKEGPAAEILADENIGRLYLGL